MRHFYCLMLLPLLLVACGGGGVRESLGLTRDAPDEFTVVSRPALSVPPDFELRPPRPGEAPRGISAEDRARAALLSTAPKTPLTPETLELPKTETAVVPVITSDTPSTAQANFMKQAGAGDAKEDIRQQLGSDVAQPVNNKPAKSLYEQLVTPENPEPVVDPKKEAERLRQNKDDGKPLNEGEVPVEAVKPPTVLDSIF
ncbi:MAG: DUF3035 domain-containing protein [Rickettsiales bacterium]